MFSETVVLEIVQEIISIYPKLANKEVLVKKYVNMILGYIKSFCNRDDVPIELREVVYCMTVDMLKAENFIETPKEVSSITRGDTSFSYRSVGKSENVSLLKDFESQLVKFKKMKIPT